jgi:molybdopterin-synthase adenylyltransferase
MKLFDELSVGHAAVSDGIVYNLGEPVGLLVPATMYGYSQEGQYYVTGPAGEGNVPQHDLAHLWASLVATKSILFGSPDEVKAVKKLLEEESTSRTVSYLCSILNSSAEVVAASRKIRAAKVAILGCGGVGSVSSVLLAGAGIKKLVLVDPDHIERSNLNRQFMWRKEDIGKAKIDVLKKQLLDRFDDLEIATHRTVINEETLQEFVTEVDAVILSADEPLGVGLNKAKQLSNQLGFTLVSCGYAHHSAAVLVHKGERELYTDFDSGVTWRRNPFFIGPSFGPTNAEIAGIVSSLIVHDIIGMVDMSSENFYMSWETNTFPRHYVTG